MRRRATLFTVLAGMTFAIAGGCPLDLSSLLGGLTGNTNTNANDNTSANSNENANDNTGGGLTGDAARGQDIYENGTNDATACMTCHLLGSVDTSGFAGDLKDHVDDITNDLGSLDAAMSGMMLSDQDIADLKSYINSVN